MTMQQTSCSTSTSHNETTTLVEDEQASSTTSCIAEFKKMDRRALSETVIALSNMERRTYKAPSCIDDFKSEGIYTNYINAGRDRTRDFFKRFAQRCSMCGDDFVLKALLTLDRFMSTYEPNPHNNPEKCIEDKEWYLIVVTILQLTIKMNCPPGYEGPTLKTYAKFYGNLFDANDLRAMELRILKTLNYQVTPPVNRYFVHLFAPFLNFQDQEQDQDQLENDVIRKAMDIAEMTTTTTQEDDEEEKENGADITNVELMGYEQSCIALACMRLVLEQDDRIVAPNLVMDFTRTISSILKNEKRCEEVYQFLLSKTSDGNKERASAVSSIHFISDVSDSEQGHEASDYDDDDNSSSSSSRAPSKVYSSKVDVCNDNDKDDALQCPNSKRRKLETSMQQTSSAVLA